jgi:hypothetical protein
MTTEDLAARLAEFRVEHRRSVEDGRRLAARVVPGGDVAAWLRSCPPAVQAAARREQEALLREVETDFRWSSRHRTGSATGGARRAGITPDDFAFRTMGR